MKINRIDKIKNHLIFKDFKWDASSLPDFKKYNLVYGWNGSGKTTLSNLLRCIEKHKAVLIGEFSVMLDNRTIPSTSFSTDTLLPKVRVFNREFVKENIFTITGEVSPIFFLGEDSIETQKKIEDLKLKLSEKGSAYAEQSKQKTIAEKDADQFTIDKATIIRELLSSSGSNPYNNYTKATYKNKATELSQSSDYTAKILNDPEKSQYKQHKDATAKPELLAVSISMLDVTAILLKVNSVLQKTVLSEVIESLKNDGDLSDWVKIGLTLHKKSNASRCLFCDQTLPKDVLKRYEGHFNDQFNQFVAEIDSLISEIEIVERHLSNFIFHNKAELYDHLSTEYEHAIQQAKENITLIEQYLKTLKNKLCNKKASPFQKLDTIKESPPNTSDILTAVNEIIAKHNTETRNFQNTIANARIKLEESLVAESLNEYKQKKDTLSNIDSGIASLNAEIAQLNIGIGETEKQIVEHRRPADELNNDLENYLGHSELKFEVFENGYQITRYGHRATGLSEGESTAIAFLYFLKSLKDKNFDIHSGIIVIDDPVSSLDANSLFYAFEFMKERVQEAGQLFILTHNFAFFRQIKNWYHYLPKPNTSYYMIEASCSENGRYANILPLDKLLHQYDSEYHYLFKRVYICAKTLGTAQSLETYYDLPNIARRLLESFLSFKHPKKAGEFTALISQMDFDAMKKSRIVRFLHTHSHNGAIDDPEHDMSILSETPQILSDVMELIKASDKTHYDELVGLISTTQVGVTS